ncbi:nucleoside deaminase [Demequina sp.]|uniref:nucleoside deaminase n=1 Tax=Demequina sp. TaxID=2050685 RepID=UPI0025C73F05|nr:nucleoside deaminase [Demequina sp.]
MDDAAAMREALAEAREALEHDDVPVGAVVVSPSGVVVGRGHNRREADSDPTAHAEVLALRQAASDAGTWHLEGHTLVVTLEPCVMCAGALLAARIPRLVIGAWDPKAGATGSQWDIVRDARLAAKVEVIAGIEANAAAELLTAFFTDRR